MIKKINKLLDTKRYADLRKIFDKMHISDIADTIGKLEDMYSIITFRLLPKDKAADVFSYMESDTQKLIISKLTGEETGNIIEDMYSDDAAEFLDEMPAGVVTKILSHVSIETRKIINSLLKYPEDSAGSRMTVEFLSFKEDFTVKDAIKKIKEEGFDKETINTCYVIDKQRKLLGTVSIRSLLLNDSKVKLTDIMTDNYIYSCTLDDQETVAKKLHKYDLIAIPIVDSERRMVGIITVDDAQDIIEEETTEDIERMAAISPSDKQYLKTGIFESYRKRIPWLLLLMISATFTGTIIQSYEAALSSMVILTTFIPMFMDTAGNAGSQSSATVIRGIALNEIEFKDIFKVIWKEIRISLLCGLTLSIANFIKLRYISHIDVMVCLVVCLTLMITVVFSKIIGSILPIFAKKLKLDPTVMSSPFITTAADAISLIVFFNIAARLLNI